MVLDFQSSAFASTFKIRTLWLCQNSEYIEEIKTLDNAVPRSRLTGCFFLGFRFTLPNLRVAARGKLEPTTPHSLST